MLPVIKMLSRNKMNDIPFKNDKLVVAADMTSDIAVKGFDMPREFLVTADAFSIFLRENNLQLPLAKILKELDTEEYSNICKIGKAARRLVLNNELPHTLEVEIRNAHYKLCGEETNVLVIVQGTATTENTSSTVGTQQLESFTNIRGEDVLTNAVHKCFASLFSERVIKNFAYNTTRLADIRITISIQKMVPVSPSSISINSEFTFDHLKSFNKIMSFKTVEQDSFL